MVTRRISPTDIESVAALHESQNGRPADRSYIERCISGFPSSICLSGDRVVGFAYTNRFAPDILDLANLLVDDDHRGHGIGTLLLTDVERQAVPTWACIILSNSELWPHPPRRSPLDFYVRNGYSVLFETEHTTVFMKRLTAAP